MNTSIRHPNYVAQSLHWEKWRRTFAGGEVFRDYYLARFNRREDFWDFERRKKMSPVPSFAKSAVTEIRNAIFQRLRDIVRRGGSETYQEAVAGARGGVDRRGSNMNAFIGMQVLSELLVMGKCGVYVDNAADICPHLTSEPATSPYLYAYAIEDILSFTCSKADDPSEFQALLLRDRVMAYDAETGLPTATEERLRRLWLDGGRVVCQFYDAKGVESGGPVRLALTRIPFVLLNIGDSLLRDVCDHQIALLNLTSSDVAYALRANYPFLVKPEDGRAAGGFLKSPTSNGSASEGGQEASDVDSRVGVSHGMTYAQGSHPPAFINPSSEPLTASMSLQDKLEGDIRKLVHLAVMSLATRASAESKSLDNQGLEAGLSYIGLVLEHGERQIAEYWAAYEAQEPKKRQIPTIKYPDRYSLKTDEDRLNESKKLAEVLSDVPSPTVRREVAKLIVNSLLGGKTPSETLTAICDEIDSAEYTTSSTDIIIQAVEKGLVSNETASLALGFKPGEAAKAAQDHAERVARIAALQGVNPAARGVADLAATGAATGADGEKAASRNVDLQGDATAKVRGDGN